MKKSILFLIFSSTIPVISTGEVTNCGEYLIKGNIRKIKTDRVLIVNEKTQSEHHVYFDDFHQAQLAIYDNQEVEVKVLLNKRFNGTSGKATNLFEIKSRIPDPLKPKDTGFILTKEQKCEKN